MYVRFIAVILLSLCLASTAHGYLIASGQYTGDGSDNRVIDISDHTSPSVADFQPQAVFIKCNAATATMFWTSSMPADTSFSLAISAGQLNRIQGAAINGPIVGTDVSVNAAGVTCWFVALANDASNDLAVLAYGAGQAQDPNGVDDSDITIAFQPEFILIKRDQGTNSLPVWRTSAMSGDLSCFIGSTAVCAANYVKQINANGWRLGTGTEANNAAGIYYALAIKAVASQTFAGTYVGDGDNGRPLTDAGLEPKFAMIKQDGATTAIFRYQRQTGDQSNSTSGAPTVNLIEAFLSTGLQLGDNAAVNDIAGTDYYYYLIRDTPPVVVPRRRAGAIIFP